MAFEMAEAIFVVALIGAALGYRYLKQAKARKQVAAGGLLVALGVALFAGVFGFPALLAAGPAVPPAAAGSLWTAELTTASDTDRTEASEVVSPDAQSIQYIMTDANMDGLGDVTIAFDLLNQNVGESTTLWSGKVAVSFIPTVKVTNIDTPIANFTADLSRYDVTYTDTDAPGDWVQKPDSYSGYMEVRNAATGGSGTITIGIPTAPSVADDLPAGGIIYFLVSVVGGPELKVILIESG
mgnify:CR=1 FL=1